MNKIKIRERKITITKVVPAPMIDILIYLLTLGGKGKTFDYVKENVKEYSAPPSYNCRCTITKVDRFK
mgnify:CR=1 FL=1